MIDIYYAIGLIGIVVTFALMIILAISLVRDQARLNYRQELLEARTKIELESFREQVKTFKRDKEKEGKDDEKEGLQHIHPQADK